MKSFYDLTLDDLTQELISLNYSKYASSQIYDWVYRKKINDFGLMSNVKKELRDYMKDAYSLNLPKIEKLEVSKDTTRKYLLALEDGSMV